jgi:hypothetical protein
MPSAGKVVRGAGAEALCAGTLPVKMSAKVRIAPKRQFEFKRPIDGADEWANDAGDNIGWAFTRDIQGRLASGSELRFSPDAASLRFSPIRT